MISGDTELPLTLHALDAVEKTTPTPLPPPVAPIVNEGSVESLSPSAPNVITCDALATLTVPVTCVAAAYFALPPWSAATMQDPAAVAVSTPPLAAQGPETIPYATARPEVAVADNVAEPPFQLEGAIAGNEMAWPASMTLQVCVALA